MYIEATAAVFVPSHRAGEQARFSQCARLNCTRFTAAVGFSFRRLCEDMPHLQQTMALDHLVPHLPVTGG